LRQGSPLLQCSNGFAILPSHQSKGREDDMTSTANGATKLGHGHYLEDLAPGMQASVSKKITNDDILAFASLSGDVNPVHLDDDFAAKTIFKKRIAHGFLTGALFSTALGTKLPGPGCVYLSQNMKFRAPVYIGDEVVATVKVTSVDPEKARVTLACDCAVNGKTVLEGEAVMMVDRRTPRS
jgi:3-hydroxybutyryl-CoA dehydratase